MYGDSSQDPLQQAKWGRIASHFLEKNVETRSMELVSTGLSNAELVRIETTTGVYLLRQWSFEAVQQTFPIPRIQELHQFLQHLHECEIPVAVPLGFRGRSQTVIPDGSDIWHCEPWLPGKSIGSEEITRSQLTAMMHTLARLHMAAATFECSALGRTWFRSLKAPCPTVDERVRIIQETSPSRRKEYGEALEYAPDDFGAVGIRILEHFTALVPIIEQELRLHLNASVSLQPCWRDLWSDHVLFDGETVSGIIDPTATRTDHIATDLSRLLGSFFPNDRSQREFALQVYSEVNPLSELDLDLIQLFDRSSVLLSGLTWLRRWSDRDLNRESIPTVLPRLQVIEQRMAELR